MERSEVVEYIYEYLCCDGVLSYSMPEPKVCDFTERHVQNMADEIIRLVEEKGMLPPSYEGCMRDGKKYVRELHGHYDTMLVRNKWEPEDV